MVFILMENLAKMAGASSVNLVRMERPVLIILTAKAENVARGALACLTLVGMALRMGKRPGLTAEGMNATLVAKVVSATKPQIA